MVWTVQQLALVADEFLQAFDATGHVVTRHIGVHPLAINTITFLGKLDVGAIDLSAVRLGMMLYDALHHEPSCFLLRTDPSSDVQKLPATTAKKKSAADKKRTRKHTQASKAVEPSTVTAKKKSTKPAGTTDKKRRRPRKDFHIAARLCAFLPTVIAGVDRVSLEWFDIKMINAGFLLCSPDCLRPIRLRPNRLSAELKNDNVMVDFETERHPGVKLTVLDDAGAKAGVVMIFQTGSVQICGVKEPRHLARAYQQACDRIDAAVGKLGTDVCVECDQLRTTTSKHPFRLVAGYPTSLYNACVDVFLTI